MKTELAKQTDPATDAATATPSYTYTPKCDVWETLDAFFVEAELPGVEESGVDVKLEDGVLSIVGRATPAPLTGYERTYTEYESGSYERAFRLSDGIDETRIAASLKHGLLRVELPKREAVKPRRIPVAVG